jgi:hypothetical protein
VRSTVATVAILILAGAGVFIWQRSQIVHLRAQVARQGDALNDISQRLERESSGSIISSRGSGASLRARSASLSYEGSAEMRADERRVILDEYRDVLAQMNLPPETSSRLMDLLTDRIETVLDAQDAAVREGFAEGSAQMARAVGLAIAEVDRDIVGLVGQDGIRRIDGLPTAQSPQPEFVPSEAPPVIVNVVVQAPLPASYADSGAQVPDSDAYAQYGAYPYSYVPFYSVAALGEPLGSHRNAGPRNGELSRRRGSVRSTYR